MTAKVEIYTKSYCPYCVKAKHLLNQKGVQYDEIDVTNDPAGQEAMSQRAEGRKTVPQIFIDGKPMGGCDDLYAMDVKGELDRLLGVVWKIDPQVYHQ